MQALTVTPDSPFRLTELPDPEPIPTEVLVRTRAVGVNPIDWKTRQGGGMTGFYPEGEPLVVGWDVAGEVAEVGPGVTRFAVGDRVFGMPRFPHPARAYAELVTSPSRHLAKIPDGVSFETAAALPLAGLTAWQCVVDTLDVQTGQRVLVHAAAGGVGHLAVQFAKARGAEVWGTASASKHGLLAELGVDHPIDYRAQDFTEVATEMDAVIDFVGGEEHAARSLACLRRGGALIVIPSPAELPSAEALAERDATATWLLVEPDHAALEAMAAMLADETLRVLVAETKPWTAMEALHEASVSGAVTGKLVATVG